LLEAKIRSSTAQINGNELNLSRIKTADQAVAQAVEIADKMEDLIVQMRSGATSTSIDMPNIMRNYLKDLQATLNMNFEGRYLFGGTNTASEPVPDITVGTSGDDYYNGAKQDLTYTRDERTTYTFPIRADDASFQKIIEAAKMAMEGFNGGSSAVLGTALDLMQSGQRELNVARGRVGSTMVSLQDTNESLNSLKLYWKGVTEEVGKTDLLAASTEVSNHEALLQAAFSVFSRLSQLRLSDYLR
jgi:flagellin-like hook-associated protein FlgL